MKVVLATRNPGKQREVMEIFKGSGVRFLPLDFFQGLRMPAEGHRAYTENAILKARAAARQAGCWALAEDSGLEVEALGGKPGVQSARFAGERASGARNNAKLLRLLEGAPAGKRKARYRSVAALAAPSGDVIVREGSCSGSIAFEPRGRGGFGYDPVFVVAGHNRTFAEMPRSYKNRMSHRARAMRKIRRYVEGLL